MVVAVSPAVRAPIVDPQIVGVDFVSELSLDGRCQIPKPDIGNRSAEATNDVIVPSGIVEPVGKARLGNPNNLSGFYEALQVVVHCRLYDFGISFFHLHENHFGSGMLCRL